LVVGFSLVFFVLGRCVVVGEGGIGVDTDCMGADVLGWLPVSAFGVVVLGGVVLVQAG
jgi:hypothetical protein